MPLPTIGRDVSPARREALRSLAGKALLFLDTCHAAGAIENGSRRGLARLDINSVINEFASAENGVVAFASSTGREDSVENDAWQNGAFTKALVEGLRAGWADLLYRHHSLALRDAVTPTLQSVQQYGNGYDNDCCRSPYYGSSYSSTYYGNYGGYGGYGGYRYAPYYHRYGYAPYRRFGYAPRTYGNYWRGY